MYRIRTHLLLVFFFFSAPLLRAEEVFKLALLPQVSVDLKHITLRDVADFSQTSPLLLEKYGGIAMPPPGATGVLHPSDIILALSQEGLDLALLEVVTLYDIKIQQGRVFQDPQKNDLKTVVVSSRELMAGEVVSAADFEEKKLSVQEDASGVMTNLRSLGEGRWQLQKSLALGEILHRDMVTYASNLQKGSVVTLITRGSGLEIRALGRVKDVMDQGTSILVENIDSKKELVGKALVSGEVEIIY